VGDSMVMILLLLGSWIPSTPLQQESPKAKAPDAAIQKEAEKLIRDIFKDQYAKKDPAERAALSRTLFKQAGETRDDANSRFVLLREARDIAAQAGDAHLAIEAIDALGREFEVDAVAMKTGVLATVAKTARTPEEVKSLASAYLGLADEAAAGDDYEAAEKAAAAAAGLARKAKELPLVSRADARGKEFSELKGRHVAFRKAQETLAASPSDPAANLLVGRFHCLSKGSWETGLPFLTKGADAPLKDLALKDLGNPVDSRDQIQVADGWWDVGERELGKAREHARARAAHWYGEAMPQLTGLSRARVEKRLQEAAPALASGKAVDLLRLIDLQRDAFMGKWDWKEKILVGKGLVELPYVPPDEYDLHLKIERYEENDSLVIGIASSGTQAQISIDQQEAAGSFSGLGLIDGKRIAENETKHQGSLLTNGKPSTVVCSIRKTGVAVQVDGKRIVHWKGDIRRTSLVSGNKGSRSDTLLIGGRSWFRIIQMDLVPVSQAGKLLR